MKTNLLSLFLLITSFAYAQWTNDYDVNTQVSDATTGDVQTIGTADGDTWVIFWDEDAGYDLKVQLLDKDGNTQFGPTGMLVNSEADNGTWTATRSNVVDSEGNVYIGFTATNTGMGYINKIAPDGTQLFGEAGISIDDAWDMKLLSLPDGGVLAGWLGGSNGMLMKYDNTGTAVWSSPKTIESVDTSLPFSNIGELGGQSDGSFIVLLHTKATSWTVNSTLNALKVDSEGNEVWRIENLSNQTLMSNRRYPLLQDGDVIYLGYYGSTGFRFDSFLQRIEPDGTLPWGVDGIDFSTDDTYYEMTTSIVFDQDPEYIWATANVCNDTQTLYGQYVQKYNKETGERVLGDIAKEVFPVSADNWIAVGDLHRVADMPLFLFSTGISDGVNPISLGVVLLDDLGDFVWDDEYKMIATTTNNKSRVDFTLNVDNQSVAVWSEDRGSGAKAYAQNIVIEEGPSFPSNCTIVCPEDITVMAFPGEPTHVVEYEISFECEEGGDLVELVLVEGLPSGAEFPIGITTVSYELVFDDMVFDSCTFQVTVDEYMSVHDLGKNSLSVYPNPVKDMLNFKSSQPIERAEIYTLSGQKISSKQFTVKKNSLNLSALPAGIYVIRVVLKDGSLETFKVVKEG